MYFMHVCIATNAFVNTIFEENKRINWVVLQTTTIVPPLTIYPGIPFFNPLAFSFIVVLVLYLRTSSRSTFYLGGRV